MADAANSPIVSIIVRTKDRPKLLLNALKSVAAQTYRPIEVVLVNDGGCYLDADELKGILGDVQLNYIRLETNMGRSYTGNVGIENAKGKYVGFLDDDDEFYAEHLSTLTQLLEKNNYNSAYTDSNFVHVYYDEEKDDYITKDSYLFFSEDFSFELLVFRNYIPFMCVLFKREALKDVRFDKDLNLYEDWDLLIRFAERNPLHHLTRTTARYNRWDNETQITSKESFGKESYLKVLKKHWTKISPEILFYLYKRDANLLWQRKEALKELGEEKRKFSNLKIEVIELNREIADLNSRISELSRENRESLQHLSDEHPGVEKSATRTELCTSGLPGICGNKVEQSFAKEDLISQYIKEVAMLKKENADLERQRTRLKEEISEFVAVVSELESNLKENSVKMMNLETYLHEFETSLAWKMITTLRRTKEKLFSVGTRRRNFYDLLIKSI
ncbi:MAG TPA: glycosyltransferase, partial [Thermodesulfovibrionales bacterium]|nr:glycosyltransferase [Thermodesulfovibrionales bacterium]